MKFAKFLVLQIINFLFPSWLFKVKPNKIVVDSFRGNSYSGNPARIVDALLKYNDDLEIVWLAKEIDDEFPSDVRVVRYNSLKSFMELATAKIWIDDFRKKYFPRKKNSQVYFQVWHGVIPLKKIEKDTESNLDSIYVYEAKRDGKIIDYMISGNEFTSNIYKNSFWQNGLVLEYGTPVMDQIITHTPKTDNSDKKIVLYCPTFRNEFVLEDYKLDVNKIVSEFEEKFGGEWQVGIRLHPNIAEHEKDVIDYNGGKIVGYTNVKSFEEVLLKSDAIITDFSSVMFEAMYGNIPVFIYSNSFNNYIKNERSVYFKLEELPFSISKNEEDLVKNIKEFDNKLYSERVQNFLCKIGNHETGKSSEKVAEFILEKMVDK
jgi:CDP-glycerol glycerophosphotransferase